MSSALEAMPLSARMPALFVGHGSPMNVVLNNDFTRALARLGQEIPRPRAIMVVSAHWLTAGSYVTGMSRPETIHDFYGFPEELYAIRYPSPGAPQEARAVAEVVHRARVKLSDDWGLDHASWAVLRHMLPQADIPVFEMSLDYARPAEYHYALAAELAPLRDRGVLIIGSGNLVHNLRLLDFRHMDARPFDWAVAFDERARQLMEAGDHDALIHYERLGREAALAIPTNDHYLPLLYILALRGRDEPLRYAYEGFQNGSISMRCVRVG